MNVLVAGELPLVEEITALCVAAGFTTNSYLVEDFLSATESGSALVYDSEIDLVIEAYNESTAGKQELLLAISKVIPEKALVLVSALATSTTQAAAWVKNPSRVVGYGLVSPLGIGSLVELAPALQTADNTPSLAEEFWKKIGLEAVWVADGPGLVRARIICCLINEAVAALMEGVASASDIDMAMKLGTNYPFGPLEWADQIGLDTVLGVMNGLFFEWGEDRYRPTPLMRHMVAAGHLGKKTGKGFYDYD